VIIAFSLAHFDSKVGVLSDKRHVKKGEHAGGMYAAAKASAMDLEEPGGELLKRNKELTGAATR
jgi:hypothetical protein